MLFVERVADSRYAWMDGLETREEKLGHPQGWSEREVANPQNRFGYFISWFVFKGLKLKVTWSVFIGWNWKKRDQCLMEAFAFESVIKNSYIENSNRLFTFNIFFSYLLTIQKQILYEIYLLFKYIFLNFLKLPISLLVGVIRNHKIFHYL